MFNQSNWGWTYNDLMSTPFAPLMTIMEVITTEEEGTGSNDFGLTIDSALDMGPVEEWE